MEKPEPQKRKPKTQAMEVHHHPNVEKKGFKEYFFEGLMIFLAVTMGFIAENIREHISDNKHIRQLTSSLVTELKHDTLSLNSLIQITTERQRNIDSLFYLLQQPVGKADTYKLQQLLIKSSVVTLYGPETGTITQLKNSGSLRLLGETSVPFYIGRYESFLDVIKKMEAGDAANKVKYIEAFEGQHFTPENLFAASAAAASANYFKPVNKNMRNITQDDLTQFSNNLMICKQNSGYLLGDYRVNKIMVTKFIKYLQKEYHLEDK